MADKKKKIPVPTPKPAFVPGKPGKATRRESNASRRGGMLKSEKNEIMAMERQREMRPYDPKDLKRMEGQPRRMKKGGEVCRGAGGVDGGNRGAQFRGVR